jgi:thioredoxin-like negative regulator of GroEL
MAPAWEQLASDYEKSTITLIAQVDCTEEEDLCANFEVQGFPTLLWGDVSDLNDYSGPRDYESFKEFSELHLTTEICNIHNLEACSQEEKNVIAELKKKSTIELDEIMQEFETETEEADALFQAEAERIENMYENVVTAHAETLESLKKEKNYAHVMAILATKHNNVGEQKDEF